MLTRLPFLFSRLGGAGPCLLGTLILLILQAGCGKTDLKNEPHKDSPVVQGKPIVRTSGSGNHSDPNVGTNARTGAPTAARTPRPAAEEWDAEGFLRLGFETLSAFKYEVYEYHVEGVAGRPMLKSDDVIPDWVRQHDGRKVTIRGFVLPLRTRKGRVTEFLLLRDQGTCCFGPQAQINHFIRVHLAKGTEFEQGLPYRVRGVIRVGETYVQGYLTGIYQLEAEVVERSTE
jgi:hypothetical protein